VNVVMNIRVLESRSYLDIVDGTRLKFTKMVSPQMAPRSYFGQIIDYRHRVFHLKRKNNDVLLSTNKTEGGAHHVTGSYAFPRNT
jgi:hypothetical protein